MRDNKEAQTIIFALLILVMTITLTGPVITALTGNSSGITFEGDNVNCAEHFNENGRIVCEIIELEEISELAFDPSRITESVWKIIPFLLIFGAVLLMVISIFTHVLPEEYDKPKKSAKATGPTVPTRDLRTLDRRV